MTTPDVRQFRLHATARAHLRRHATATARTGARLARRAAAFARARSAARRTTVRDAAARTGPSGVRRGSGYKSANGVCDEHRSRRGRRGRRCSPTCFGSPPATDAAYAGAPARPRGRAGSSPSRQRADRDRRSSTAPGPNAPDGAAHPGGRRRRACRPARRSPTGRRPCHADASRRRIATGRRDRATPPRVRDRRSSATSASAPRRPTPRLRSATILGIRNGQRFTRRRAPRELRGTASADPSGLWAVKLRLTRRFRGTCWYFSGSKERFLKRACGKQHAFKVGEQTGWSYLLPARLPRGRYALDVYAVDNAFNNDRSRERSGWCSASDEAAGDDRRGRPRRRAGPGRRGDRRGHGRRQGARAARAGRGAAQGAHGQGGGPALPRRRAHAAVRPRRHAPAARPSATTAAAAGARATPPGCT